MICRADEHYKVHRDRNDMGDIVRLSCVKCDFTVSRSSFAQPKGSKSGVGRYNLMRARMVKHIHADHRPNAVNEGRDAP